MAWFKVDDGFLTSSKVMSIPRSKRAEALGVWLAVGVWSAHEMKDGLVPAPVLEELGCTDEIRAILIEVALWVEAEKNMILIHNWDKYQPTKASLEAKRDATSVARSEAGKRGMANRYNKDLTKDNNALTKDNNALTKSNPEPEPEPIKEHLYSEAEPKQKYSQEFETFWATYPRRQQKGDAWKAWETLRKKRELPELSLLTDTAKKYGDRVTNPQFQKLPAGWLRSACWDDEPLGVSQPVGYVEREGYAPGVSYHPPAPEGKRYAVDVVIDDWN